MIDTNKKTGITEGETKILAFETIKAVPFLTRFANVQLELRKLKPDKMNSFKHYKYISLSEATNTIVPLLFKNGLIMIFEQESYNSEKNEMVMKLIIRDLMGGTDSYAAVFQIIGEIERDKAAQCGKIATYAKRMLLFNAFAFHVSENEEIDKNYGKEAKTKEHITKTIKQAIAQQETKQTQTKEKNADLDMDEKVLAKLREKYKKQTGGDINNG